MYDGNEISALTLFQDPCTNGTEMIGIAVRSRLIQVERVRAHYLFFFGAVLALTLYSSPLPY